MKLFINEDADWVDVDSNEQLRYYDDDAIPFIVTKNFENVYYGKPGSMHEDLIEYLSFTLKDDPKRKEILATVVYRNSYHGRLWLNDEVIAFYNIPTPEEMRKIVGLISQKYDLHNFLLDTNTYDHDGLSKLVLLQEYMNGDKITTRDVKRNDIIHLMDPEEKSKTPQMQSYLKNKVQNQSNKLTNKENNKEMTRAEYNALKRPYSESKMSDSEPMLDGETLEDYFNRLLHKKVWNTDKFKRDKELHINGSHEEKKEKYGGYLNRRYDNLTKKLKDMPEVEYRYLKGENKNRNTKNMKKQIRLTESELKNYISEETSKIVYEMKLNVIYNILKRSINETLEITNSHK